MRTTQVVLEKHFGNLAFVRGILYYKLSPYEQKPFAGAIRYGIPNFIPRTYSRIGTWLPQFVLGYLIYQWTEYTNHMSHRKNPKDYINEVDPNPPPPPEDEKRKCEPKKKS